MGRADSTVVLTEELAGFLSSGIAISIATRDGDLNPNGTRAWAAVVDEDRRHVTAYLYAKTAGTILRDLEAHPRVALGFDRPSDSRACQLKGAFVGSARCRSTDRQEIDRQFAGFLADLERIGFPRAAFTGWKTWPAIAVRFAVTDIFVQTPGPGAGERMR